MVTDLADNDVGFDLYAERFYVLYFLCNNIDLSEDGTPEYRKRVRRLPHAVPQKL